MNRRGSIPFFVTILACVAYGSRSLAQQPTFVTTPASQTLCEGAVAAFDVEVNFNGGQQPLITWAFDGGGGFADLTDGDRNGRVTITTDILANPATSVLSLADTDSAADEGIYKCTATSLSGGTFVIAMLDFEAAPTVDPIVVVPGDFNGMCLGDEVSLDAQPGGSDPQNQAVVWGFAKNGGSPNTSITQFFPHPATATPTFTPLASGTYVLEVTTFDCTPQAIASATLTVEVFAPLSASPTPAAATTCVTVPVQMAANPSGGDGNYEFLWSVTPASGSFWPNATAENPTFTPFVVLPAGAYELSVTVSAPASAAVVCAASDPAIALVTAQTNPVVTATTGQSQLCVGGSEALGVDVTPPDGEYVYAWSIIGGPDPDPAQLSNTNIASPTFTPSTPSAPGTPYQLQIEVSGGNCEPGSDTIDIVVNAAADVTPTATPAVVCVGGSAQMAANPSGSDTQGFQWTLVDGAPDPDIVGQLSPSLPTDENPIFTPTTLGTYQLQIQLFDAFCDNPDPQTVDVEAMPALTAAPTPTEATVCPNTPVSLFAHPSGGGGTYTFSWSVVSAPGGGTGEFSTAENPTFIPMLLGTYTLEVVVSAAGCEATDPTTVTIEVINQVNMTATTGDAEVCLPNSTGVEADTGGVTVPVMWSILDGSPDTDPAQLNDPTAAITFFTPSTPGQYTLQAEATFSEGDCGDSTDTVIIDAFDVFTAEASAGSETVCLGEDTSLLVTTTASGVGAQQIAWSILGGPDLDAMSQISDVGSDAPTFTPTAATSPGNEYIIEAAVFDPACGVTLRDSVTVTVNDELTAAPSADLPGLAACEAVAVDLSANATGGDGTYTYLWSIAIGPPSNPPSIFDDPNLAQPTFTPMVGPANFTLDLQIDDELCESTEVLYTLPLQVEAALAVAQSAEFERGVLGESMSLHANEIGGTAPAFTWTVLNLPDDCTDTPLTGAGTADPTFTPGCVGTYSIRLAATDPVCIDVVVGLNIDVIVFVAVPSAMPPGLCGQMPAQSATLSANLSDSTFGPFTYVWSIVADSPNTSGAQFDSQTAAAPIFTPTDVGVYTIQVVATQTAGELPDITGEFDIEVSADAPAISSDPADVTVCAGEPATFTIAASGTDLSLQWMLDGVEIPDETTTTLAIQTVAFNDAGTYTCVASNGCNAITSQPAVLTVEPPLTDLLMVGVREDAVLREADSIGCTITGNLIDRGAMGVDNQGTPFDVVSALAVDPLNNTLYGAVRVFADHPETYLVTIDPITGTAELIASMGQPVADLAFHLDGTLYAIRGNNDCLVCPGPQGQPGEIFTVDLADATLTALDPPLDFGTAKGHTITFDDRDILNRDLYHHAFVPNSYSRLTRTDLDTRQQVILRDFDRTVSLTAMTIRDDLFIAAYRASPNELWSLDPDNGYQETVLGPVLTPGLPNRSVLGLAFICLTAGSGGDVDSDCDIDLEDFSALQACIPAPPPLTVECAVFDSDGDGDVDLTDWGAFQITFTGTP